MSEENDAALSARLDELIEDRDNIQEEWIDGYISYDEAVEQSQMVSEEIKDIMRLLNQGNKPTET